MTITALDRQGNPLEVYYKGPASGDPQHKDHSATTPGLTARYPNTEHGIVIGRAVLWRHGQPHLPGAGAHQPGERISGYLFHGEMDSGVRRHAAGGYSG